MASSAAAVAALRLDLGLQLELLLELLPAPAGSSGVVVVVAYYEAVWWRHAPSQVSSSGPCLPACMSVAFLPAGCLAGCLSSWLPGCCCMYCLYFLN